MPHTPRPTQPPAGAARAPTAWRRMPPVPPERWLTSEARARSAPQPARQATPSAAPVCQTPERHPWGWPLLSRQTQQGAPPRLRARGRWIVQGLVLALIVLGFLAAAHQGGSTSTDAASKATTSTTGGTAPQGLRSTAHPTSAPFPRPAPTNTAESPAELAAHFLSAYFTWTAGESDQAYLDTWRQMVVDTSVAALSTAAPRLSLDEGNDSQATSPLPTMAARASQVTGQVAQVAVTWTMQVLPAGGELVEWASRRVQATVALVAGGASLQVSDVEWTST